MGLDSYDHFSPNQDTLPKGDLGNLIALPLQKQSRENAATASLPMSISLPFQTNGPFVHSAQVRPAGFRSRQETGPESGTSFQTLYRELLADEARNRLICEDVLAAVREGRSPVVLTERIDHLGDAGATAGVRGSSPDRPAGGLGRKKLREALARLATVPEDEERVLLTTGHYLISA